MLSGDKFVIDLIGVEGLSLKPTPGNRLSSGYAAGLPSTSD